MVSPFLHLPLFMILLNQLQSIFSDDFRAIDFAFAPDGNKMLITSQNDTYCCAIEAQEDSTFMQDSRL